VTSAFFLFAVRSLRARARTRVFTHRHFPFATCRRLQSIGRSTDPSIGFMCLAYDSGPSEGVRRFWDSVGNA